MIDRRKGLMLLGGAGLATLAGRYVWREAEARSIFLGQTGFPYDAFDRLPATPITVGGGTIRVAFAPGGLALSKPAIFEWVRKAATAVTTYYGHYPVKTARLLIVPVGGGRVQTGTTWGYRGIAHRVLLGADAGQDDIDRDWIMTHEMVHSALPDMDERHNWLSEGLAVYIEPIARVQAGFLTPQKIWTDMVRDMPQGLPQPGDAGLDNTPTWARTYWGGALFCLLADIDIRTKTGNRRGLQDAMRGVLAAGGSHEVEWPIRKILATADKAVGVEAMLPLYERLATKAETVDLPALWKALGVEAGGFRFRNDSPFAAARMAIIAGSSAG